MSESDVNECPLCMDMLEIDDLHFYPCTCGYQICRFCWHRIRTDGNGKCPACRKTYGEKPASYRPLSQEEIKKAKRDRKRDEAQRKQKISDNRKHLSNIRVIQKHLVFVVGLSQKLADPEVLKRSEYFGKYGKIVKIIVNPNTNYAGPQGPSASAYITYIREEDCLRAILAINQQANKKLRASLGTTKYCTHYLRNTSCPKSECMYLHELGDEEASFTKEDMQAGKHQIFEKNLIDNYVEQMNRKRRCPPPEEAHPPETTDNEDPPTSDSSPDPHQDSQEDWEEEEESNNSSSLPSQSSWGAKSYTRPQSWNITSSVPTVEEQAPTLTIAGGTRPPQRTVSIPNDIHVQHQQQPVKPARPASIAGPLPVIPASSNIPASNANITESIPKPTVSKTVSDPPSTSIKSSQEACRPTEAYFKTGWATSHENSHLEHQTSNTPTSNNQSSNNQSWPGIFDLGLADLNLGSSIDDELGFDPFTECKAGLEDLIAAEAKSASTPPVKAPSYSWDSFWPSSYMQQSAQNQQNMMQMNNSSYSLFGAGSSYGPSRNQYQYGLNQQACMPAPGLNPPMNRYSSLGGMSSTSGLMSGSSIPSANTSYQQQQQQQHQPLGQPDKNWQDEFRALLPNINISFANSYNNWQQQQQQQQQQLKPQVSSQSATPTQPPINAPPGLTQFSTDGSKTPSNAANPLGWMSSEVPKQPPGFTSAARRPPPGFGNLAGPQPQYPASVSSVIDTVLAADMAAKPYLQPNANNMMPNSEMKLPVNSGMAFSSATALNNPDKQSPANGDHLLSNPSHLPTGSLTDVSKLQATTVLPHLPTVGNYPDLLEGSEHQELLKKLLKEEPATDHLTGANQSVLSAHFTATSLQQDAAKVTTAPPGLPKTDSTTSGNEEAMLNAQKPSPIFGHQKKAVTKKPTAHVKPHIKSNTDGFTTVQGARQSTPVQTGPKPTTPSSGSRVSELDDFSADFPVVSQANKVDTVSDAASSSSSSDVSSSAPATTSSKSKKRKKKNKEAAEATTEVILPKMDKPVASETSESEAEKAAKKGEKGNKKKKNTKSPPLSRKVTPPQKQTTLQQQQQQEGGKSADNLPKGVEENLQDFEKYQKLIQSQVIIETLTNIAHGKPPLDKIPEAALRLVSQDTSALATGAASGGKITSSDHEVFNRLTESTEKLLKNVLFETEAIKLNTEQISKDLKSALEKCKEPSLTLTDLEKINQLLTPNQAGGVELDEFTVIDTSDLERQVESARREAKILESRLNDVIRKNMASELETLKRNTKGGGK